MLTCASGLFAVRIFVYAQVSVWMLFFTFSILLIVAAVKVRLRSGRARREEDREGDRGLGIM